MNNGSAITISSRIMRALVRVFIPEALAISVSYSGLDVLLWGSICIAIHGKAIRRCQKPGFSGIAHLAGARY
jgi:hypothetical protein